MKPNARYPRNRENVTQRDNAIAAFAKVTTAPLHTLTPAMLESIANSHAPAGPKRVKLLERLQAAIAGRRERETA